MRMAVRNITLKQLRSSLTGNAKTPIKIAERPTPYPGRKWPTRVAWEFEIRTATEGLRDRVAELVERRRRLTGRAVVYTTHKEKAELKRDQVLGYGPDPRMAISKGPLGCYIEPAPTD